MFRYSHSGGTITTIDWGNVISEDTTSNPLIDGKDRNSFDDVKAYIEGSQPNGLGQTIDTDSESGLDVLVRLFISDDEDMPPPVGRMIDAVNVTVDDSSFNNIDPVDVPNAQIGFEQLDRLYGLVARLRQDVDASERPLHVFNNSITVISGNFDSLINRNCVYGALNDKRVDFILPSEAVIGGNYPAIFEIQHFGGTQRFDTGFMPTNTVVIRRPTDYSPGDSSTFLRRDSETGANLQFSELHRGDTAVIRKEDVNSPWVVVEGSTDPRTSILPDGVFQFNSRGVTFPTNTGGDHIVGGLTLYTPNKGDAFEVTGSGITEESTFGRSIDTGDVIVAKQDDPSLVLDENNEDWLIIRDAGHGEITLTELRFLAQISETDTFSYTRAETRSDVTDARVFFSPFILDHAPFISPSTDPDNPQTGETGEYIGGDELDGSTFDFQANTSQLGTFAGASTASAVSGLLYVDIDGSFDNELISRLFVEHLDIDGTVIERLSLSDDFRVITLTGSGDTYYVFDDVGATDNFSNINFHAGHTLNVVERATNRQFNISNQVNVLNAIADGSLDISKLTNTLQAIIQSDHSLTNDQASKLRGLESTTTSTAIGINEPLYVKLNAASSSNDLSHYVNVEQGNGILPDYERTREVFFLVHPGIAVTGLQEVETPATKLSVTAEGTITTTDGQQWQAFSATLPAITGDNQIVDHAWQIDGTVEHISLSGAVDTFKVHRNNLDSNLEDHIFAQAPSGTQVPEVLTQLSHDLTRTTATQSGWRTLPLGTERGLTREAAKLWTEDIRTDDTNVFDDISDVQFTSFDGNNRFYYADANSQYNTAFPGHNSYILNNNVRISNSGAGTNIMDVAEKIVMFDYSLQRPIADSDGEVNMVRFGTGSAEPLMTISHEEGLALSIGRGDGAQRTRTYDEVLQVDGGHWHDQIDETVTAEAQVIIPDSATGSLTVRIEMQLDNNGNDEGTHTEEITITDVASDQTLSQETFNFSGFASVTVDVIYDAVNNDLPNARRVLFLRPTASFTNAALTYNVRAFHRVTENWNVATTYAKYPVNSGDPHDRFGSFDPSLWNTERVRTPEHVAIMLRPYRDGDTDNDPEMAAYVVVDGEHEGNPSNGRLIRLHRPKSDFDTSIINIGNTICAVSHIQVYRYSGTNIPTEAQFYQLTTGEDNWLNAFTDRTDITDRFTLDADLQLGEGKSLIMRSPDSSTWFITVSDAGALETTEE